MFIEYHDNHFWRLQYMPGFEWYYRIRHAPSDCHWMVPGTMEAQNEDRQE